VQGQTYYPYHTIERTTYDKETGNFTVYISGIDENNPEDELEYLINYRLENIGMEGILDDISLESP
jgi:hypothetical protein